MHIAGMDASEQGLRSRHCCADLPVVTKTLYILAIPYLEEIPA